MYQYATDLNRAYILKWIESDEYIMNIWRHEGLRQIVIICFDVVVVEGIHGEEHV